MFVNLLSDFNLDLFCLVHPYVFFIVNMHVIFPFTV